MRDVPAGGHVQFDCAIDLLSVRGHFGSGFSLVSQDLDEPVAFIVRMYRPIPPTAEPSVVEFGEVAFGGEETRHLQIETVADTSTVVTVSPASRVDNPDVVTFEVGEPMRRIERFANAEEESVIFTYPIRARCRNLESGHHLTGTAAFPVQVGDDEHVVIVTYRAMLLAPVSASPSKKVLVLRAGTGADFRVSLSVSGIDFPLVLATAACSRPEVEVSGIDEGGGVTGLAVSVPGTIEGYDATIEASLRSTNTEATYDVVIPLAVRVIPE